jgi:hypothetical protein
MFSYGFCYGGSVGFAGYRQEGTVLTAKDAQKAIKDKLAGKKVIFQESEGKFRAYADGERTGYIYFAVKADAWVALDTINLGEKGRKATICKGSLAEVKTKVRGFVEEQYGSVNPIETVHFDRTGDNIKVRAKLKGNQGLSDADVVLVKIA